MVSAMTQTKAKRIKASHAHQKSLGKRFALETQTRTEAFNERGILVNEKMNRAREPQRSPIMAGRQTLWVKRWKKSKEF